MRGGGRGLGNSDDVSAWGIEIIKQLFFVVPDYHSASLNCAAARDATVGVGMGMEVEHHGAPTARAPGKAGSAFGRISERATAMMAGFATPSASDRDPRPVTGLQAAGVKSGAVEDYFSADGVDQDPAGTNLAAILEEKHVVGGVAKKRVKTYRLVDFDVERDDLCLLYTSPSPRDRG